MSKARHAATLRPVSENAFLEPKPQIALITVAVCACSYDTIHYCYKQHPECSASALLSKMRAATKRLNEIKKRDLNASLSVGRPSQARPVLFSITVTIPRTSVIEDGTNSGTQVPCH